jgi:catechol 2,3-dioxygenase-like lactoylglutathione lyase family enzyme
VMSIHGESLESSRELGVHSLDHFALTVPDLEGAERFYTAFGLDVKGEGTAGVVRTKASEHRWALLLEGKTKRLHHLSFGVFPADFPRFKGRLQRLGVRLQPTPPGLESEGLWFQDPDGVLVELRVAEKSSPDAKVTARSISSPEGVAGAPKRSAAPRIMPSRLSHVLTFTRNVPRAITFYRDLLGLRLSDRSGDDIAFLHGPHGSDHHLIAFTRSNAPGLHHCCWDVSSVNDIGLGAAQMAKAGYMAGWGLGRHVLGSNYFHYVRDPWGSHSEYSCDMDYIPAGMSWIARDHEADDAFYVWGPEAPRDWTVNHEAEAS